MKIHELKILPEYFQSVWDCVKTFELRKDDRNYQPGDFLVLKEWDGEKFTGSALCVKVTYVLRNVAQYGLQDGYIIMGISHIKSPLDLKPYTKGDEIRAMSDNELGKLLCGFFDSLGCDMRCPARNYCSNGHNGMIDYLRKEASDVN